MTAIGLLTARRFQLIPIDDKSEVFRAQARRNGHFIDTAIDKS
jgi:hypothetical protein